MYSFSIVTQQEAFDQQVSLPETPNSHFLKLQVVTGTLVLPINKSPGINVPLCSLYLDSGLAHGFALANGTLSNQK